MFVCACALLPGSSYGRGYTPTWPAEFYEGATDAQKAVLEPPYNPRMNRVTLDNGANARQPRAREGWKVEFDERVFGTRYY